MLIWIQSHLIQILNAQDQLHHSVLFMMSLKHSEHAAINYQQTPFQSTDNAMLFNILIIQGKIESSFYAIRILATWRNKE